MFHSLSSFFTKSFILFPFLCLSCSQPRCDVKESISTIDSNSEQQWYAPPCHKFEGSPFVFKLSGISLKLNASELNALATLWNRYDFAKEGKTFDATWLPPVAEIIVTQKPRLWVLKVIPPTTHYINYGNSYEFMYITYDGKCETLRMFISDELTQALNEAVRPFLRRHGLPIVGHLGRPSPPTPREESSPKAP